MVESDTAGFTLVEMLVSLAVTALIAVLLIQALQTTGLVTLRARRSSAQEEVQIVRDHLRRMLAEVVRRHADDTPVAFVGEPNRLVATVLPDRDLERGSELRVGLATAEQPGTAGLALMESRSDGSETGARDPDLLLGGIAGLHLRYFGVSAQGMPPDWTPSWIRPDRLPALVEVTVAFFPADRRRWPALVIPLGAAP